MYFEDHSSPHFYAIHGNHEALISINKLKIIKGGLPPRAYGLVAEWAMQHQNELQANCHSALLHKPLNKIKPSE